MTLALLAVAAETLSGYWLPAGAAGAPHREATGRCGSRAGEPEGGPGEGRVQCAEPGCGARHPPGVLAAGTGSEIF